MPRRIPVVYDLCGGTGAWSRPWREAGYDVRVVDITDGMDVRLLEKPAEQVDAVLAAPPCTDLCIAGAESWERKGDGALTAALEIVGACLRFAEAVKPKLWALENPAGRLTRYLGSPAMWFDPCDFGDPWTKRTGVWGQFNFPTLAHVEPTRGSIMDIAHNSRERAVTPSGFARAFFEANRWPFLEPPTSDDRLSPSVNRKNEE